MRSPSPGCLAVWLLSAGAGLVACTKNPAVGPPPPSVDFRPEASVQDLMVGLIDPSADSLWDSVAYISSPTGIEDRQPRTDEQWNEVRRRALMLIEGGNLLIVPGRRVAAARPGAAAAPSQGELSQAEIQQRLETLRTAYVPLAQGLQAAGDKALAAIDARDAQALMDAGTVIDEACEACHVVFWYPNQRQP